jgi:hypothetical protein
LTWVGDAAVPVVIVGVLGGVVSTVHEVVAGV